MSDGIFDTHFLMYICN